MEKLYQILPHFFQNLLITAFNLKSYRVRYGGQYKSYRKYFKATDLWTLEALEADQQERFASLVEHAQKQSAFYKEQFEGIPSATQLDAIAKLPIISKELIRQHSEKLHTIPKQDGVISKTGGTTGKSLEVVFTKDNFQERFALLDNFRNRYGYELGKKTAWFSGKSVLTQRDIKKNRFWKTDYWYHVRYYSTFHIKDAYLKHYISNLQQFAPEYLVGFPSNMYEIAKYGLAQNQTLPKGMIKAIFPTAETVTEDSRTVIERFFNAKVYDQYASSEGAPFIFECGNGSLHLELQSGVFEVLDDNNEPARSGRMIVTSFTTYGTPLIRYDIGDNIILGAGNCGCGNNNPLVEEILGRIDDFVYSPENGKINLGNVSNTLKDTKGIVRFQAVQDELDAIIVKLIVDDAVFTPSIEKKFIQNWRDRIGETMRLDLVYVNEISVEKSGKFRMVRNNIKHLIQ